MYINLQQAVVLMGMKRDLLVFGLIPHVVLGCKGWKRIICHAPVNTWIYIFKPVLQQVTYNWPDDHFKDQCKCFFFFFYFVSNLHCMTGETIMFLLFLLCDVWGIPNKQDKSYLWLTSWWWKCSTSYHAVLQSQKAVVLHSSMGDVYINMLNLLLKMWNSRWKTKL